MNSPNGAWPRLCDTSRARLPASVRSPAYDRRAQRCGIVHIGIGAFHRAHQAVYTDRAMSAGARDWNILGVSLRSAEVADRLNPQDGWYLVAEQSAGGSGLQLVGAVQGVVVASQEVGRVDAALRAPETRIVSLTITEKGYCRLPTGGLDLRLARGSGLYPRVAEAFRARRAAGLPGLTLLCCDNLPGNGALLRSLVGEYLAAERPDVLTWFETECTCPSTMVDRIVPATTADSIAAIAHATGIRDEALVVTEAFSQWVVEDRFAGPRPPWEQVGVQLVSDVHPYETAKLRLLNGAHSALAYLGLAHGHEFVHQAVADSHLRPLVEQLMKQEAAPSVAAAPGMNLAAYADALLERFGNAALNHRLAQIAMDGSQKIPQRWLQTLAFHQQRGQECPALLAALGAWLVHVRGESRAVDDPLAAGLAAVWAAGGVEGVVDGMFGAGGLLASEWRPSQTAAATLHAAIHRRGLVG